MAEGECDNSLQAEGCENGTAFEKGNGVEVVECASEKATEDQAGSEVVRDESGEKDVILSRNVANEELNLRSDIVDVGIHVENLVPVEEVVNKCNEEPNLCSDMVDVCTHVANFVPVVEDVNKSNAELIMGTCVENLIPVEKDVNKSNEEPRSCLEIVDMVTRVENSAQLEEDVNKSNEEPRSGSEIVDMGLENSVQHKEDLNKIIEDPRSRSEIVDMGLENLMPLEEDVNKSNEEPGSRLEIVDMVTRVENSVQLQEDMNKIDVELRSRSEIVDMGLENSVQHEEDLNKRIEDPRSRSEIVDMGLENLVPLEEDVNKSNEKPRSPLEIVVIGTCVENSVPVEEDVNKSNEEPSSRLEMMDMDTDAENSMLVEEDVNGSNEEPNSCSDLVCIGTRMENSVSVEEDVNISNEEPDMVCMGTYLENSVPVDEYVNKCNEEPKLCSDIVAMGTHVENSVLVEENVNESNPTIKESCHSQTLSEQDCESVSASAGMIFEHGDVCPEQVGIKPSKSIGKENQLVSGDVSNAKVGENCSVGLDSDNQTISCTLKVSSNSSTKEIGTSLVDASTTTTVDNTLRGIPSVNHLENFTSETDRDHPLGHGVPHCELAMTHLSQSVCTLTEHLKPPTEATVDSSLNDNLISSVEASKLPCTENLGQSFEEHTTDSSLEKLETAAENAKKNSGRSGWKNRQNSKFSMKKYPLRSLTKSDRVLRSRSPEAKPKATESNTNSAYVKTGSEKPRKKRKRREKKIDANEYSGIRKHLRYLLHRIRYENNLIDAYSTEGWKGLSLEKLKPEKELQHAKSVINRYKLKIRDLFQRIEMLSAVGKLPESLFDSEGEIDSEDIFCAKCGTKDVSIDNDIILCDGACDRGFHQYCLEPPLPKEDIPSGDDGWLCPACDCKVDCIDLVDDSLGTNISIFDSWEKVFPEALAGQPNDNIDLSTDESDGDYNPDGPDSSEEDLESDSSSDESKCPSASDGLGEPANNDSDDSEDDDFNPDAPDPDVNDEKSSDSDFTSASEDLCATLDPDKSSGEEGPICSSSDNARFLRGSKSSLRDELVSLQESDPAQEGPETLSGRRHVERLDYKRLYKESYGNVPSSSSDDEDYNDIAPSRKSSSKNVKPASNGKFPAVKNENSSGSKKRDQKRNSGKLSIDKTNHSPEKAHENSSVSGSSGKRVKSATNKKLGESVTKKLYQSFKDNQYPKRQMKENLATELGITFQQVSKWFENARWSARHPSHDEASLNKSVLKIWGLYGDYRGVWG